MLLNSYCSNNKVVTNLKSVACKGASHFCVVNYASSLCIYMYSGYFLIVKKSDCIKLGHTPPISVTPADCNRVDPHFTKSSHLSTWRGESRTERSRGGLVICLRQFFASAQHLCVTNHLRADTCRSEDMNKFNFFRIFLRVIEHTSSRINCGIAELLVHEGRTCEAPASDETCVVFIRHWHLANAAMDGKRWVITWIHTTKIHTTRSARFTRHRHSLVGSVLGLLCYTYISLRLFH